MKYNEGQEEENAFGKQKDQTFKMKTPAACHRAGTFHVGIRASVLSWQKSAGFIPMKLDSRQHLKDSKNEVENGKICTSLNKQSLWSKV